MYGDRLNKTYQYVLVGVITLFSKNYQKGALQS